MADMWVLDRYDNPLAILSSDAEDDACTFYSDNFREELNQGASFSFTCNAMHEDSKYITGLNQVVFKDEDGYFRLFRIREIDRGTDNDSAEKIAHCEPAEMELLEAIVEDLRPTNKTQQYALDKVLEGTRWRGNVTAQTGTQSTNFYHINAYEAINKIIEVWGGELRFTVNFDEENNKIIERVVNIEQRRGNDEGDRFEVGFNVESIHVTDMVYPVSALYGWGGSEETENGGNTRYLNFADVEWRVSNGDPANKPLGQTWIELPGAKEKYGYKNPDGTFINSFGQWQDENILDPKELLQKTFEHLRDTASKPQATYELKVIPTDHISLGDTRTAIDDTQAERIQIQSRVIALEYSISNPAGTKTVEMGEFLEVYQPDRRLDDIEDKIKNIDRNVQVTDGSFPDIIPKTPTSVTVKGSFDSVSITWDYDPSSYIAAYEVYCSKTTGFTPSIENRLWRGKQSGCLHENAGVDNVWYYRVRVINYHGKASEFTPEISAKTQRILTDDILFGAVTADRLADLAVTADKLSRDFSEANILPGSLLRASDINGLNSAGISVVKNGDHNEVTATKTKTDNALFGISTSPRKTLSLVKGQTYTISFELKRGDIPGITYLNFRSTNSSSENNLINTESISNLTKNPADQFVRVDLSFESPLSSDTIHLLLGGSVGDVAAAGSFSIRKLQIRRGLVKKEYTFSPFDVLLTDGSVTSDFIANAAIGSAHIQNAAINSANIADAVITSAKIAEAAVGTAAIQNAAITKAHLKTAIIDTAHIIDGAITNAKIGSLSADKITSGTIKAIDITGSLIKGGRFEPLNESSAYKSYIEGNKIYQRRNYRTTSSPFDRYEEMNITSGQISMITGSREGGTDTPLRYLDIEDASIQMTSNTSQNGYASMDIFCNDKVLGGSDPTSRIQMKIGGTTSMNIWSGLSGNKKYANIDARNSDFMQLNGPDIDIIATKAVFLKSGTGMSLYGGSNGISMYDTSSIRGRSSKNLEVYADKELILKGGGAYNADFTIRTDSAGPQIFSKAIYNRTYSSAANVHITSYGTLGRVTSASKYKLNIEGFPTDKYDRVLELIPKTWYDKSAVENYAESLANGEGDMVEEEAPYITRIPGLIAEDVEAAGLSEFVSYGEPDENGKREIEGLMYDRLITLLIPIVKRLKGKVESIEGRMQNAGI
ncbi:phage tail spike protein [Bacillus vallismortis]|uniref:phage tail spike protein n=1 Tax=Bacillus vallismortis TaxID=72361 RepID=UPI003DB15777